MIDVSVIIPNYNHSRYLSKRIDSVLNQTYQNFELIILDDCSTDDSRSVIEQYRGHANISAIVYNESNSGSTFRQWQKGLRLARGKYIWIAESDDYADPLFLETLIKPFHSYPDLVISYCQSAIIDEEDRIFKISDWAEEMDRERWKSDYIESSDVELDRYLKYRNIIPNASAVVFRKPDPSILDEAINLRFSGDWLFYRKLLSSPGKIAYSCKPLNHFRYHQQSTRSVGDAQKAINRMREMRHFIQTDRLNIFESRYDWMIIVWYENRPALKTTKYYYIPDLPPPLIIRTYWIGLKKALKRLAGLGKR